MCQHTLHTCICVRTVYMYAIHGTCTHCMCLHCVCVPCATHVCICTACVRRCVCMCSVHVQVYTHLRILCACICEPSTVNEVYYMYMCVLHLQRMQSSCCSHLIWAVFVSPLSTLVREVCLCFTFIYTGTWGLSLFHLYLHWYVRLVKHIVSYNCVCTVCA